MASELRFAFKCGSKQRNSNRSRERASPNNTSDISNDHRFHPLGPPYSNYEFDASKNHIP